MTAPAPSRSPAGWQARLGLIFARHRDRTRLARNRHSGPLLVQRPLYPEGPAVCHGHLLHPPGGVVGGDSLRLDVETGADARALLTTPGATRFYRSAGPGALVEQRFVVRQGGCLEWLPQENILFPGARVALSTRVDLEEGAGFLGWEVLCLGLPVNGAGLGSGSLRADLELRRQGRPLLVERLRLGRTTDPDRPAGLRGHPVTGTFVATGAGPGTAAWLREHLPAGDSPLCGITRSGELLVIRCLGRSTMEALDLFRHLWQKLRPRLAGRAPCPPRIWTT